MQVLLIADDHRLFADGLSFIIDYATTHRLAGIVQNGNDVLPFLQSQPVDLLLLDIDLPGQSGFEVALKVRQQYPDVKILAISMLNDYDSVQTMLRAGASGYCLKSAGKDELLGAINTVCAGEVFVSPSLVPVMTNGENPHKFFKKNILNTLTAREVEVLKALAKGKGIADIADMLFVSKHTVESHRKNIYAKLDLHSIVELMMFVRENKLDS
jgi:DNA-binding NarL/FixJ family response regulator